MILNENWLTEPRIDFEYKKYKLLAYWQQIERLFRRNKLYPFAHNLNFHLERLNQFQHLFSQQQSAFSKALTGIDLKQLALQYAALPQENEQLNEVGAVAEFAQPYFSQYVEQAATLRETLMHRMEIQTVGLLPLYQREGYLFVTQPQSTSVFLYQLNLLHHTNEALQYQSINTTFVTSYNGAFRPAYTYLKRDLIRQDNRFPNPATFALECELDLPLQETLLPLATQVLYKEITA